MKKTLIMLLCMLIVATCALASCDKDKGNGGKDNSNCQHTFGEEWYGDDNNHWHPALCEHGEIKDSLGEHVDEDQDGLCDVCARNVGHDHSFADEWTYDEFNHWKVATCLHTEEKSKYSLHVDDDNNGVCDACTSHVHKLNGAGYCLHSDCGEKVKDIDETKLDQLVLAVYDQNYLVNGGTVDYMFEGKSNTGFDYTASKHDIITYLYGKNNYTHTFVENSATNAGNEASGTFESWHQLTGPDATFGVVSVNGEAYELDISNVDRLKGYYIALSTLAGEYGPVETLYALYKAAVGEAEDDSENLVSSPVGDIEIEISDNENKVTFKYNYKTVFLNATDIAVGEMAGKTVYNVNYFEVEVTFCYSDEYALTEMWISCDCYTNDPGTNYKGEFLEADVDLDYDPKTDTFTLRENALADNYTITVTQTVGDRTEENPNPKEKFIPKGFDFYLSYDQDNGVLSKKYNGTIIQTKVKDITNLYIGDCVPEGTSIHFVADQVTYKLYKDGVLVENPDDYLNQTAVAIFTFSGSQRSFFVIPKESGTYKLEIYVIGELMKEVYLSASVSSNTPPVLNPGEYAVEVAESYEWMDEFTFTAGVAGTYGFKLPENIGFVNADEYDAALETPATDDGPKPYYDYNTDKEDNPDRIFYLDLEAGEEIRFYVNATSVGTYVIKVIEP